MAYQITEPASLHCAAGFFWIVQMASSKVNCKKSMWLKVLWLSHVLAIWLLLLVPVAVPEPLAFSYSDKLIHAALFFWLTVSAFWLWRQGRVVWILLVVALLTELTQAMTPWRSAEGLDVLADAVGIGLGWVVLRWRARIPR
jgi:VanZ family protein